MELGFRPFLKCWLFGGKIIGTKTQQKNTLPGGRAKFFSRAKIYILQPAIQYSTFWIIIFIFFVNDDAKNKENKVRKTSQTSHCLSQVDQVILTEDYWLNTLWVSAAKNTK